MNTGKLIVMLSGLLLANVAVADRWDTSRGKYPRQVQQHLSTQVNIVVAPQAPIRNWAPRWNNDYRRGFDRRRDNIYFSPGLGMINGNMFGVVTAPPVVIERNYYVREYAPAVTVIEHRNGGMSISLFKDRFGACYERETDRHGRVIQRRVADYNCNF